MPPDSASIRTTLLLRSLEETDALGKVISLDNRERATRDAADKPSFLATRAESLLRSSSDAVRRAVDWAVHPPWGWVRHLGMAIIIAALLIGWFSNELGPDRIVNIISFPLLGLVLWNVLMCSWMLLLEFRKSKPSSRSILVPDESTLRKQFEKRVLSDVPSEEQRDLLSRGVLSFFRQWHQRTAGVTAAKSKIVFHLAALALAGGIVLGIYVQGLVKEYRAAWESTFLDSTRLHSVLGIALGPASALTGIPLPPADELAAMRLHPENGAAPSSNSIGGNAAPFIHLWAATAGIFVGIPRLLLLVLALRQATKQQPDWTPELLAWEEKLKLQSTGKTDIVDVLPVYYSPEPGTAEAIRSLVLQVWGGKTRLNFLPQIELGEEEEYLAAWKPSDAGTVLAFSFANTPEQDVQGELVRNIAEQTGTHLLIITDALSFEQRHHTLPEYETRLTQRTAAWQRVLGENVPWVNITLANRGNLLAEAASLRAKLA